MDGQILKWLKESGATKIRESGTNQVVSTCPFHRDRYPSFCINVTNGLFVCYAQGCGVSGNIINFLMGALGWRYQRAAEAIEYLNIPSLDDESVYELPEFERRRTAELEVPKRTITEGHLGMYRFCPTYMLERGYPKSLLKHWEIGFDYGAYRVTFPVRDVHGALVGISKRSTLNSQNPKYLHLGFKKSNYLYGAHRCRGAREVVVTEGQPDLLAWYALRKKYPHLDLPPSVSTMGSRVALNQINLMSKYSSVILAFDNDSDGRAATVKVGEELLKRLPRGRVKVLVHWPEGCKDVGDVFEKHLTEKQVRSFVCHPEPYDSVRLSIAL